MTISLYLLIGVIYSATIMAQDRWLVWHDMILFILIWPIAMLVQFIDFIWKLLED